MYFPELIQLKKFCIVILRMEIFILFFISMVSAFFPGSYFHSQKFGTLNLLQNVKFQLSSYRDCKGHFKGDFIV